MIVGRDAELRLLREEAEASTVRARVDWIIGSEGVGKSALVAAALSDREMVSLELYPDDRFQPLAAAAELARNLGITLSDEPAHDLLRALERRGPVTVGIEDAHLMDLESQQVVWQVMRRLRMLPVWCVITSIDTSTLLLDGLRFLLRTAELGRVITLAPLTEDQVAVVLERRLTVPIKSEVLAHITDISGGYPALVVSIADQLALGARSGTAARSLEAIVADSRVAGLLPLHVDTVVTDASPETQGALLALALGGQLTLEEVSVALTGLGLGRADNDALMTTGLVDRIGNVVRIRHSVAKRAVLERSGASQVRAVHAAPGEALPGRRGLEHRAASAVGPEAERVGREVKEQVEAALLHRDYALAFGLATSAIGLDPTWVTEALLDAMRMGQPARVVELADRIEALVPSVTRSVGLAVVELELDQIEAAESRLSGIQVDHIRDDREVVLVAHGILHAVSHAAAHAWVNVGVRFAPLVARLGARLARGSMDPAYGLELTVNRVALHIVLDHLLNDDVPPANRIEGLFQLRTQITHVVGGDVLDPFLRALMALFRFYSGQLATASPSFRPSRSSPHHCFVTRSRPCVRPSPSTTGIGIVPQRSRTTRSPRLSTPFSPITGCRRSRWPRWFQPAAARTRTSNASSCRPICTWRPSRMPGGASRSHGRRPSTGGSPPSWSSTSNRCGGRPCRVTSAATPPASCSCGPRLRSDSPALPAPPGRCSRTNRAI
jgi:hypothetical protein